MAQMQETVTLGENTRIPLERYIRMMGTAIALAQDKLNRLPIQINQRKAYQEFGRKRVMRWVELDLITPIRSGGCVFYNSRDLLALSNDVQDYLRT